jgi:hypothetical protein
MELGLSLLKAGSSHFGDVKKRRCYGREDRVDNPETTRPSCISVMRRGLSRWIPRTALSIRGESRSGTVHTETLRRKRRRLTYRTVGTLSTALFLQG